MPSDRLFLGTQANTQSRLKYWLWSCLQRLLNNMYTEWPHPYPALFSAIPSLVLPILLLLYHCQEGILPKMHTNAQNKQAEGGRKKSATFFLLSFHTQSSTTGTRGLLWRKMCIIIIVRLEVVVHHWLVLNKTRHCVHKSSLDPNWKALLWGQSRESRVLTVTLWAPSSTVLAVSIFMSFILKNLCE